MTSAAKTYHTRSQMRSVRNMLLHAVYLSMYAFVKYLSFPLFNYLRYVVLKIFSKNIKTSYIMDGVTVWFPWRVSIGRGSSVNQGVIIDGFGTVTIGEGVRVAAYCSFNTTDHAFDDPSTPIALQGFVSAPIVIEDDVWLGTGVHVNKGVRIGKGSVIGSGSVVTKDIPPYSVAVGVPCKKIQDRREVLNAE